MSDGKVGGTPSFNVDKHVTQPIKKSLSKTSQWLEKHSAKSVKSGTITELKNRIRQETSGSNVHGNLKRNIRSIVKGENLLSADLRDLNKNLGSIAKKVGQIAGYILLKGVTKTGRFMKSVVQAVDKKIQKHIGTNIPIPRKLDDKYGDANIHFLGGTTIPQDEISEDGRLMQRGGHYLLENNVIKTPQGDQIHVGTAELNNLAKEWVGLGGIASGKTFNEFVNDKMENNPEFKAVIETNKVRYFSDDDRKQAATTFENGKPMQIGLDSENTDVSDLKAGTYAFALGKDKLFMAPKTSTKSGRIQHSSFLKGGKAQSAGMIVVGDDGKIAGIRNQSGHYQPHKKEMAAILNHLKSNMPAEDFEKIHLSINVNTGWRIHVANFLHHKLHIKWGIVEKPAHEWLADYKPKPSTSPKA